MRASRTSDTALVVAAQSGDRRALDALIVEYLPFVYTIVARALGRDPDVDDVVQDVMLRAVRQLPSLREPDRFRAWLAAIAMRLVRTHLRRRAIAPPTGTLPDTAADVQADVAGMALLHVELSSQRHQVVRASRWLDADDRALLSLWWLEVAGKLTRAELAAAMKLTVAHVGVRVQRMRQHLDLCRAIEVALTVRPRCEGLHAVVADWDGRANSLWRKRIVRHTRSCTACALASEGLVPAERLLAGQALLPVPLALTAGFAGMATSGAAAASAAVKAGIVGHLVQAVAAHPVAAAVTAGALVAGTTAATTLRQPAPPPPPAIVAPTVSPGIRPPGTPGVTTRAPGLVPPTRPGAGPPEEVTVPSLLRPVSLESVNFPGRYIAFVEDLGVLAPAGAGADGAAPEWATFEVVPGLSDATCYSFRAPDGRYLRHLSWRLRLSRDEGTEIFRGDATFCVRAGPAADSVLLESSNYPGWFLRHRDFELWVDQFDGSAAFEADGAFLVRPPLAA